MNTQVDLNHFAERYAQAWCSHDADTVGAFFAEDGSLTVNDGPPAVGRPAIAEVARGFFLNFPDLIVTFDKLEICSNDGGRISFDAVFHWTLIGHNAGTGNAVRISGYEMWKFDASGLVLESKGHFDAADYERQIRQ